MHYYIDGYNLLFRMSWHDSRKLQELRQMLIVELDQEANLLGLQITIVFDATLQSDDLKRGHFRTLEIIFTALGVTADDYLIETFAHLTRPNAAKLITSDSPLRHRAKCMGVQSMSCEDFLVLLRKKSYKKKQMKQERVAPKKAPPPPPQPAVKKVHKRKRVAHKGKSDDLPELDNLPAWEKLFS